METKICIKCAHHVSRVSVWCIAPQNGISPVTGEVLANFCSINRSNKNSCGEEGLWWVPLPEKQVSIEFFWQKAKRILGVAKQ